jgi:lipoate-protein ligase A
LYGWKPACISLGRNQDEKFLDKEFLKDNNIDVVRRLTGGRALLHDDEITYSFICPTSYLKNGEHVISSYIEISQILIEKFKKLGIELNFGTSKAIKTKFDYCMLISTGADLCYKNKKLIGSAQCRKNGYILQHGSILYDYNKPLLEKIFREKINTEEVTTIKEINPKLTKNDIIKILEG